MTREWGQGNYVEDLLLVPRSRIERSQPRHRMHDSMLPGDNTGASRLPIGPWYFIPFLLLFSTAGLGQSTEGNKGNEAPSERQRNAAMGQIGKGL